MWMGTTASASAKSMACCSECWYFRSLICWRTSDKRWTHSGAAEICLSLWDLEQIALKLKPELETAAKQNQGLRTDLSVNLPKPHNPIDTRKAMAHSVGIEEQAMGRIAQLAEDAPKPLKDALDNKEVSVNRAWKILKAVRQYPPEKQDTLTAEMLADVREVDQADAESDQRREIADIFCKAYEKAVLLTPTTENVRCWVRCTRMTAEEVEDSVALPFPSPVTLYDIADIQ